MHSQRDHSDAGQADEPEPTLAELVTSLAGRLRSAWRDGLAPWGLSPHQGRALLVVALEPELRLTDLASRLRIAPRSATEVVDALVEAGLAERHTDDTDRRATLIGLTSKGRTTVRAIRDAREKMATGVFDRISERDRVQLQRILGRLTEDR